MPDCSSCTAYASKPALVGILFRENAWRLSTDMGCTKNVRAVQWGGPCSFYEREPGSDDESHPGRFSRRE